MRCLSRERVGKRVRRVCGGDSVQKIAYKERVEAGVSRKCGQQGPHMADKKTITMTAGKQVASPTQHTHTPHPQ